MSYFKTIAYIDLYESNEKRQTIGFTKLMLKDKSCKIQISIKGMPITDTLNCTIKEVESKKEIDHFSLVSGQGNYEKEFVDGAIGTEKLLFSDMKGLYFVFSNNRYGICHWVEKEKKIEQETVVEEIVLGKIAIKETTIEETVRKERTIEESTVEESSIEKNIQEEKREEIAELIAEEKKIYTDKWQQLCRMFPMVHPFDENEGGQYLTIEPKDFVVLNRRYQGLLNNSFLLHGYYNYHHILLGRKEDEEGEKYYIGVPGNFYQREKSVAVMFGFEAFESGKNNIGRREQWNMREIPQGTYGYYLCRVEI